MNYMQSLTGSFGFIVGFLVTVLVITTFAGEQTTTNFLMVVLVSMVVINQEKVTQALANVQRRLAP